MRVAVTPEIPFGDARVAADVRRVERHQRNRAARPGCCARRLRPACWRRRDRTRTSAGGTASIDVRDERVAETGCRAFPFGIVRRVVDADRERRFAAPHRIEVGAARHDRIQPVDRGHVVMCRAPRTARPPRSAAVRCRACSVAPAASRSPARPPYCARSARRPGNGGANPSTSSMSRPCIRRSSATLDDCRIFAEQQHARRCRAAHGAVIRSDGAAATAAPCGIAEGGVDDAWR